jgi:hypothetical protein
VTIDLPPKAMSAETAVSTSSSTLVLQAPSRWRICSSPP